MDNRKFQAAASASPPDPEASPSTGYPTDGNPATATPATIPGAAWFHQIGEELRAVIEAAGLTPDATNFTQLRDALTGRLLRTSVYINVGGVLKVSVNGAAFVNASSTFAKHPLAKAWDVEVQAPGGAGGGTVATGATTVSSGAGGAAGGYARKLITSDPSGSTITVGAGALGVVGGAGNNGASSSFGALVSATGGAGGPLAPALVPANQLFGHSTPGDGVGGDINIKGGHGKPAFYHETPLSGEGGASAFGPGAEPQYGSGGNAAGRNSTNYGSGASGAECLYSTAVNQKGGDSASGIIIVRECA